MFPTINRYYLNLASLFFRRLLTATVIVTLALPAFAWTIKSRELVDVQIAANGSLTILVTAPATESPGLYLWKSGAVEPTKICAIASPSFFSFNRRIVMERVRGEYDVLRLYDASSCAPLGQIETTGHVIDADARDGFVAIAIQYTDEERALELYSLRGKRIATTQIGRNVELGFAPDGKTLLNFDLSDNVNASWRIQSLARVPPPRWMNKDEVTFIPGAQYVKQYADGSLSIAQWATGKPKYITPTARTVRVRQLSSDGRYGVTHERLAQGDSVAWLDFATGTHVQLSVGSIDHAAISANGTKVAWSQRGGLLADEVTIMRATVTANGMVATEN